MDYLPGYLLVAARVGARWEHLRGSVKWAVDAVRHSHVVHSVYDWGKWCANCAVLTSVHLCGHGWESITAGILLLVVVVGLILFKETSL
jgi:hypothetical protein